MILLIFAIVVCGVFLSAEIPVYYLRHDEIDLLIIIFSAFLLAGCIAVLYWF